MSKFASLPVLDAPSGVNFEGGPAFRRSDRETLAVMAATALVAEPLFYGDTTEKLRRLAESVAETHPEWLVKLAVFVREQMLLRSVSHLLVSIAARRPACRETLRRALPRIVQRPDDLTEITALLLPDGLPHVVRRFGAEYLEGLSEYHALKYRRAAGVGLKHLVRLFHPRPPSPRQGRILQYALDPRSASAWTSAERSELPTIGSYERLKRLPKDRFEEAADLIEEGRLPWEIVLPLMGSDPRVWSALLPNMPIMALLRNLRNLAAKGVLADQRAFEFVASRLADPATVQSSKLLPFRWLAAYREMEGAEPRLLPVLERAIEASVESLPRWPGTTVIAVDLSGSMAWSPISKRSSLTPADIACMLAACARSLCERSVVVGFASRAEILESALGGLVLAAAGEIRRTDLGGATNGHLVPDLLAANGIVADRMVVLTDMEMYGVARFDTQTAKYMWRFNPRMETFVVNLQPYGNFVHPMRARRLHTISGWSDAVLRYVALMDDKRGLVGEIDSIAL